MNVTFLPVSGFWSAAPVTFLQTAPVEKLTHTSLPNGISPPLYRGDGFFVLPPVWTEVEISSLAGLWSGIPVTLELSDEDSHALIATIDSNVVTAPPT